MSRNPLCTDSARAVLVIGTYPRCFDTYASDDASPLSELPRIFEEFTQESVGLHVLPCYPSDGDFGFAPRSWFDVDSSLGSWGDLQLLAKKRPLILDGVYNHVGVNHPWARQFLRTGSGSHRLHVYRRHPGVITLSPRGRSVLHRYDVCGREWWAWQTFSHEAIDIQLEDPEVRNEIRRHLAFLKGLGVHTVRLDAAAYYGRNHAAVPRDMPPSIRFVREIAADCENVGLRALAQFDCNDLGIAALNGIHSGLLQDFAFPPSLITVILSSDVEPLVWHLKRTWNIGVDLVRAPRTHDGIYLRTKNLAPWVRGLLLDRAASLPTSVRTIAGKPYELNDSFPYLCSLGVNEEAMWRRMLMAFALTAVIPGMCYLYFPALLGWVPENKTRESKDAEGDPRYLNRIAMPREHYQFVLSSSYGMLMQNLLQCLVRLQHTFSLHKPLVGDTVRKLEPGVLEIRRGNDDVIGIFNFRLQGRVSSRYTPRNRAIEASWSTSTSAVEALDFKIWARSPSAK